MSPAPRKRYPAYDFCPTCGRYGAVKVSGQMYIHSHKTRPGGCRGGKVPPLTNEEAS